LCGCGKVDTYEKVIDTGVLGEEIRKKGKGE